jgi:TolA-binding protein
MAGSTTSRLVIAGVVATSLFARADAPPAPDTKLAIEPPVADSAATDTKAAAEAALRRAVLQEFLEDAKIFQSEAREFQEDTRRTIRRKLDEKKAEISKYYNNQIHGSEGSERDERLNAVALFERFVASYPNDEKYTPDAMTRLAELYYEQTKDESERKLAEYEQRSRMGITDEAPPSSERTFEKSIALYQQIITRFPNYRLNDAIHYLLGWCLNEQGEPDQAVDVFKTLTQKYPDSRYVPEAWVRIGEYYFDSTETDDKNAVLKQAINAYTKAIQFKDSPFYDKALYKLGWSFYRLNDFDRAVQTFIGLVDYYDAKKTEGGEAGDLRSEAIQYTAVSFGDETWGGVDKLNAYLNARGPHSYDYELFRKLGDFYYNVSKFEDAVTAYRIVLQRNPLAPDAPVTAQILIKTLSQAIQAAPDRYKAEDALTEGDRLVELFADGGAWMRANQDDPVALQSGRDLVERVRLSNAQFYYKQALNFDQIAEDKSKAPDVVADAIAKAKDYYAKAARSYDGYIRDFPRAKNIYDVQFALAYSLYRSQQYLRAADIFTLVRDSKVDNTHLIDSAYYVVASLQKEISEEENQGLLLRREACIPVELCKNISDFKPLPIADIRLRLIDAADTYLKRVPKAEDAPQLSYIAGRTFLTYFHFEDARKRYYAVVKQFPETEYAQQANDEILISLLLEKKWDELEKFVADQMNENPAIRKDKAKFSYMKNIKYTSRFNRANDAMQAKKWDEAAKLYESILVDSMKDVGTYEGAAKENPRWAQADKALYNAALSYKENRKFDSAMQRFEDLFKNFPESPLAEQALFSVAENAEKAFDFEKAIENYNLLVKNYTKPEHEKDRQAAQFNKARLLEALQRYDEAAKAFQAYADLFPNAPDAGDQAYEAAAIYARKHDNDGLIAGLNKFIAQFKNNPDQAERIVEAHRKIAKARKEKKDQKGYETALQDCVKAYDDKKMGPDNYRASQAASECRFELAERDFEAFAKLKFDPKGKDSKRLKDEAAKKMTVLADSVEGVKKTYTEIITRYRWPDMMIAALYRLGDTDMQFAEKLMSAPCPDMLKAMGEDACQAYADQLGEKVLPITERASESFKKASDKAFELRIVNEWSKRSMEMVCKNTPKDCRSLKDPRAQFIRDVTSPLPLTSDADGMKPATFTPAPKAKEPEPTPTTPTPVMGIGAPGTIVLPGGTPTTPVVPAPTEGTPTPPADTGAPTIIVLPPGTDALTPGGSP